MQNDVFERIYSTFSDKDRIWFIFKTGHTLKNANY